MFIMDVCQRVWDDLEDEDVDQGQTSLQRIH